MAKKICNICNVRPVNKNAGIEDACMPCYDEGGWENTHDDREHDRLNEVAEKLEGVGAVELRKLAKGIVLNPAKYRSAELRELMRKEIDNECAGCWICHPELNEAQRTPKTRKASEGERPSRKGQKITVPLRASGTEKAKVVIGIVGEERVKLNVRNGEGCTLDVNLDGGLFLHLAWDHDGRYDYAEAYVLRGGKRTTVRNVAEALRIVQK